MSVFDYSTIANDTLFLAQWAQQHMACSTHFYALIIIKLHFSYFN